MLEAYGWAIARSTRAAFQDATPSDVDAIDEQVARADQALFVQLQEFLRQFQPPDLDWHFRPHMNNATGVLTLTSSRNHRGDVPTVIEVLQWLAQHGPGSYGLVYLHDDEDRDPLARTGRRDGRDHSKAFRVWRLSGGRIDELDDPFLSPIGDDALGIAANGPSPSA